MKIAIITDIHANMEAFEQVSADIARSQVDDIISLGDHIGYGPQPEEVIKRIRQHKITALQGNHELALVEPTYLDWFNHAARKSLNMTNCTAFIKFGDTGLIHRSKITITNTLGSRFFNNKFARSK